MQRDRGHCYQIHDASTCCLCHLFLYFHGCHIKSYVQEITRESAGFSHFLFLLFLPVVVAACFDAQIFWEKLDEKELHPFGQSVTVAVTKKKADLGMNGQDGRREPRPQSASDLRKTHLTYNFQDPTSPFQNFLAPLEGVKRKMNTGVIPSIQCRPVARQSGRRNIHPCILNSRAHCLFIYVILSHKRSKTD